MNAKLLDLASPHKLASFWRANRRILVLCVTTAITMLGQGMVAPVLPLFAKDFGASVGMIGVVVGIFGLSRLGVNLPSGYAAQRFGSRVLLVAGPALVAVASVAAGAAPNLPFLVLFRFLAGVGSAMYMTGAMIYVSAISTPANRGSMMSYQQGSLLIGVTLGSALGGYAAEWAGSLRATFYGAGVLTFLASLWAFVSLPNVRSATQNVKAGAADDPPSVGSSGGAAAQSGMVSFATNVPFLLASLFSVAVFFTRSGASQSLLPLMATERAALAPGRLGTIFFAQSLINLPIVFAAGYLSDRYGRKAVMVPSGLMVVLTLVFQAHSYSFLAFLSVAVLMGLSTGIGGPAPAAYAVDSAPLQSQGVAMGLFRTLSDLGLVVGPVLLGFVADRWGFTDALYVNAALFLVVSVAVALWARDTRGQLRASLESV